MFKRKGTEKLFRLMEEQEFDAIMIAPSSDMEYLIDYNAHVDERLNCLVLLQNGDHFHISPMLNYEEAKNKYEEGSKFYIWSDGDGFLDTVVKSFKEYGLEGKKIGVNYSIRAIDMIDIGKLIQVEFKNAHRLLEEFRIIKTEDEVKYMKEAGRIADEVMLDIKGFIRPGVTEQEVCEEIVRLYGEKGAESISFDPIVAAGPNSSMPHYNEGTRVIEKGDNVVVDCGCRYNNVCSDTSRTFFVGEPSADQRKIYEICKKSTFAAQEFARAGATAGEVDKVARDIIEGEGYGENFLNRTGHGIGFSVHEAPYIKPNSTQALEDGMAFSIEPGIYISGKFGMRVENILVIENGEAVSVNHSPTDIEDVIIHL